VNDDIEFSFHGPNVIPKDETYLQLFALPTLLEQYPTGDCFALILIKVSCFLIKQSCLPQGVTLKDLCETKSLKTLPGQLMVQHVVILHGIRLQ
jgi:hypothetical protein